MINKIKDIWKDPVGSKIIATIICAIPIFIIDNYKNDNFLFKNIKSILLYKTELWIILIFILLVILIIAILNIKKSQIFKYDEKSKNLDEKLFENIRTNLLNDEVIFNLKNNLFSNHSFEREKFEFIHKTLTESEKHNFEFFHPEIEKSKNLMIENLREFRQITSGKIYSSPNNNDIEFLGIPKEWEEKRFYQAADEIDKAEKKLENSITLFYKIARKIFKNIKHHIT